MIDHCENEPVLPIDEPEDESWPEDVSWNEQSRDEIEADENQRIDRMEWTGWKDDEN